ncbi:substrate-binding periplasmic protein [Pseudomonas caspiana]
MFVRQLFLGLILSSVQLMSSAQAEPWQAGGTQWRPFSYEGEQGQLRGIATDIARRVLQLAEIDAQFVSYPVNRLQAMLIKGELDLNYADSVQWNNAEEVRRFAFSKPYMNVREHLYVLKGSPIAHMPVDKLIGQTVGVVRGYTYRTMDPLFADKRLTRLQTSEDPALLQLLQTGRVDAVAMVDDLFEYLIASKGMDRNLFERGAKLSEAPLGMKLQPQYAVLLPRINAAIASLVRSGEVARIRHAYLTANDSAGETP